MPYFITYTVLFVAMKRICRYSMVGNSSEYISVNKNPNNYSVNSSGIIPYTMNLKRLTGP